MSWGECGRIGQRVVLAAALVACNSGPSTHASQRASALSQAVTTGVTASAPAPAASANATITAALHEAPRVRELLVPRAVRALTPSGHFDINFWGSAVNTHTLLDTAGKGAVPVSEARFLWGHGQLYVAFYAGDLDLEVREKAHDGPVWNDDSVALTFFTKPGEKRMISVSPMGVLADGVCPLDAMNLGDPRCALHWESHARVGVDYDGTINKLGDFDEEWNIQLAIPLTSLGLLPEVGTRIAFAIHRCDMAFDGQRACGEWGSSEQPAQLLLQ